MFDSKYIKSNIIIDEYEWEFDTDRYECFENSKNNITVVSI